MAWSGILDQPFAVRVLRAHVAKQHVPPAYLFSGPDGVGKRLAALELAKALNCERPGEEGGCGACAVCQRIERRAHPDVHWVAPEGASASIRIEPIRQLLGRVALRPFSARLQVAVIDAAHRLTEDAANSLLKTLEEPPTWTRFVLLSAQPGSCLPTVRSRCRMLRFRRLADATVARLLVAQQRCDESTAQRVGRQAQGSLETAGYWLAQRDEHEQILSQLCAGPSAALAFSPPSEREPLQRWLASMIWWLRDVAIGTVSPATAARHAEHAADIRSQADSVAPQRCADAAMRLAQLWDALEQMGNARAAGALAREVWMSLDRTSAAAANRDA